MNHTRFKKALAHIDGYMMPNVGNLLFRSDAEKIKFNRAKKECLRNLKRDIKDIVVIDFKTYQKAKR